MIIDCIADLHGHYPKLEGGDLLIVAGDLTAHDYPVEHGQFLAWIDRQRYKKKIVIAGNHDNYLQEKGLDHLKDVFLDLGIEYLCDSGTEFEYWENGNPPFDRAIFNRKLKIWGSPWTAQFAGINPKCCAFTVRHFDHTEELLAEYWKKIPDDTDILITHGPPFTILDKNIDGQHCGSISLGLRLQQVQPKLHIFGHIHEAYGRIGHLPEHYSTNQFINCSYVNEHYQPVNKPVRVIL